MRFRLRQSIARLRKIVDMSEPAAVGILDFVYAPYALGDSLTWQTNVMCNAHDAGLDAVKLFVIVEPGRPSSRLQCIGIKSLTVQGEIIRLVFGSAQNRAIGGLILISVAEPRGSAPELRTGKGSAIHRFLYSYSQTKRQRK